MLQLERPFLIFFWPISDFVLSRSDQWKGRKWAQTKERARSQPLQGRARGLKWKYLAGFFCENATIWNTMSVLLGAQRSGLGCMGRFTSCYGCLETFVSPWNWVTATHCDCCESKLTTAAAPPWRSNFQTLYSHLWSPRGGQAFDTLR